MRDIIEQIWQLPWYQVLIIAVVDDVILLVKMWPVWVVVATLPFVAGWLSERNK